MTRVILVYQAGTVDECIVLNDGEVEGAIQQLNEANNALAEDERVDRISVLLPSPLEHVLEYIKNP